MTAPPTPEEMRVAEQIAHEHSGCWGGTGIEPHTHACCRLRDAIAAALHSATTRYREALQECAAPIPGAVGRDTKELYTILLAEFRRRQSRAAAILAQTTRE